MRTIMKGGSTINCVIDQVVLPDNQWYKKVNQKYQTLFSTFYVDVAQGSMLMKTRIWIKDIKVSTKHL